MEKKLDGYYTRMLRAILNKSRRQYPTKQQLYGHQTPIMKTIKIRRTRHAGHCWRSREEFISDVLQWTPSYGRAKAGRPARTYIRQISANTGCSPEDLPGAMRSSERGSRISVLIAWWWWWWWWYVCVCELVKLIIDKTCTKFASLPWRKLQSFRMLFFLLQDL